MKKIFTFIFIAGLGFSAFAQSEENNLKNFRFGLKIAPSLNWYKPEDEKKFAKDKTKLGLSWGLQTEFRLNKVASLVTGLQVDYDKAALKYSDTANYFYDTKNEEIIVLNDGKPDTAGKQWVVYKLNSRYFKTNYVTLPLHLKMKTPEIGYMTYFGDFGVNTSFRLKSKSNDAVTQYTTNFPSSSLTSLDNTSDMNIIRFQLHVGGGAEYSLAGSTAIFFSAAYNLGFSNVLKKESNHLLRNDTKAIKQNASAHNIALTIGILF